MEAGTKGYQIIKHRQDLEAVGSTSEPTQTDALEWSYAFYLRYSLKITGPEVFPNSNLKKKEKKRWDIP